MKRISLLAVILSLVILSGCEYSMKNVLDDLTQPSTFTVTYDANGGTGIVPEDINEYKEGFIVTTLGADCILLKDDFYHAGWNTSPDGNGTTYTPGQTFNIGKSNITLYARWSNNPVYRITYDANGAEKGSAPVDYTYYETSSSITILGNTGGLNKSGYSFSGWNTNNEGKGSNYIPNSPYIMGSENITLYANWTSDRTYTVTYNAVKPGSSTLTGTVPVDTMNYPDGASAIVSDNTENLYLQGYNFSGWNTASDGSGLFYQAGDNLIIQSSDINLYSMWTAKTIKVTFDYGGGTGTELEKYVEYDSAYGTLPIATLTGYSFDGWYTGAGGAGRKILENTIVSEITDHTLFANFINYSYRVSYALEGGTSTAPTYQDVESPKVTVGALPENPTKTGFNFVGWYTGTNGSGTQFTSTTVVINPITVYALWTDKPVFTVTFNTNGGSSIDTISVIKDNLVPKPSSDPTRTGYVFDGWYKEAGCTTVWNFSTDTITAATTIYAKWKTYSYTVAYDQQGATTNSNPSYKVVSSPNTTVGTLPIPPDKTLYSFSGWYTTPVSGGTQFTQNTTVSGNIVVYARWNCIPRNWRGITSSSDGKKIAAVVDGGYIYTSGDSGATWTERTGAGSQSWRGIAGSTDGTRLAAIAYNGYIYTSSDSGVTWKTQSGAGSKKWTGIACSDDGTKLGLVHIADTGADGYILTGSLADGTWTWLQHLTEKNISWTSIACSSVGTKIVATKSNGYIYTGTNSGKLWLWSERTNSGTRAWRSITCSDDRTKIAAAVYNGYIYTSDDSGATWTQRSSGSRKWISITSSDDGLRLFAGTEIIGLLPGIYVSYNSGVNWASTASSGNWYSITSINNGQGIAIANCGGYLYTAYEKGGSWTYKKVL